MRFNLTVNMQPMIYEIRESRIFLYLIKNKPEVSRGHPYTIYCWNIIHFISNKMDNIYFMGKI
jgi:hypothetical protein